MMPKELRVYFQQFLVKKIEELDQELRDIAYGKEKRAEIIDNKAADATTKIDLVVRQLREEADYAYADFDEYKAETLGADADELPDDDFRYGLERAIEIIKAVAKEQK